MPNKHSKSKLMILWVGQAISLVWAGHQGSLVCLQTIRWQMGEMLVGIGWPRLGYWGLSPPGLYSSRRLARIIYTLVSGIKDPRMEAACLRNRFKWHKSLLPHSTDQSKLQGQPKNKKLICENIAVCLWQPSQCWAHSWSFVAT